MLPFYPSLLAADLSDLPAVLKKVEDANPAGVHIDVMDGNFVPNKSFDFALTEKISTLTSCPLDIHFMTKNPAQFVLPYLDLKPARVSVHVEENPSISFFKILKEKKIKSGIVIDLPTDVSALAPYLNVVDFIVVMSVKCGAAGQAFSEKSLDKIKWIRNRFAGDITLDGGINDKTILMVEEAGATAAIKGSSFFK